MKRAVKYCGGCNPWYDRVEEVRSLEKRLNTSLLCAIPRKHYDEIYVICGCTSRCADISTLSADRFIIYDSPQ